MYFDGEGVEQSFTEARKLYNKSADQNYSRAQLRLGQMMIRRQGGSDQNNMSEGFSLVEKASSQGNEEAKAFLNEMSGLAWRKDESGGIEVVGK